jgi:hypothetical protein
VKPQRIIKLLEMASHPRSGDNEALNALRLVRNELDKADLTFDDLPTLLGVDASLLSQPRSSVEEDRLKSVNEALTGQVADQAHEITILLEKLRAAQARANTRPIIQKVEEVTRVAKDHITWQVFEAAAKRLFHGDWQAKVTGHLRISVNQLAKWQRTNMVPEDQLLALLKIKDFVVEERRLGQPGKRILDIKV